MSALLNTIASLNTKACHALLDVINSEITIYALFLTVMVSILLTRAAYNTLMIKLHASIRGAILVLFGSLAYTSVYLMISNLLVRLYLFTGTNLILTVTFALTVLSGIIAERVISKIK